MIHEIRTYLSFSSEAFQSPYLLHLAIIVDVWVFELNDVLNSSTEDPPRECAGPPCGMCGFRVAICAFIAGSRRSTADRTCTSTKERFRGTRHISPSCVDQQPTNISYLMRSIRSVMIHDSLLHFVQQASTDPVQENDIAGAFECKPVKPSCLEDPASAIANKKVKCDTSLRGTRSHCWSSVSVHKRLLT